MLDEESGLRGYLLTHDVGFLEPYVRGEAALAVANDAVATYVGAVPDVSAVSAAMVRTRVAEEKWRELWANAASDTRPYAIAPSMSEGKTLFDSYRREESAFAGSLQKRSESLSRRRAANRDDRLPGLGWSSSSSSRFSFSPCASTARCETRSSRPWPRSCVTSAASATARWRRPPTRRRHVSSPSWVGG